jgi:hypothetical protein
MTAIFAFKIIHNHYKPINDDFIRLAKLSVKSAKKFYKTKIYCDVNSHNFFTQNNIFFDEVVIINEFIDDYPGQYSIPKIYAMIKETEPYILMDLDVVLFEKLEPQWTITYGYPEINFNRKHVNIHTVTWAQDAYVTPFINNVQKYYTDQELSDMNWSTYPSFCVVIVKNPIIMSMIFKTIFKLIDKKDINEITPTLLEQFLSHQYIIKYNVDFGFISEDATDDMDNPDGFDKLRLISNKFVHLHINKPIINNQLNFLEEIIN